MKKLKDMTPQELEEHRTEQLAEYMQGIVNGLREHGWTRDMAFGNMLIHLTSNGYLKLREEHYVKKIIPFDPISLGENL